MSIYHNEKYKKAQSQLLMSIKLLNKHAAFIWKKEDCQTQLQNLLWPNQNLEGSLNNYKFSKNDSNFNEFIDFNTLFYFYI